MPLLQESAHPPKRDVLTTKVENDEVSRVSGFPSLSSTAMFTPSQLLVASQTAALMAASGLGLPGATPGHFFHPGLFATAWGVANRPPSPVAKHNNNNNNNNVVTSSSAELKQPKRKTRKLQHVKEEVETETKDVPKEVVVGPASRDKQFTCGVCSRSFGYKHVLQNHERTHTGEKPFECPECHKRFTRDHHLKTHMRLHTGERPYHCEYCDRQFVQVANLRRHLRVHTGERPYACQYCTARFSDSNQLKAHVLIHKGEKPFECARCRGRFRRRHHLVHHKCVGAALSPPASDLSDELPEQARRQRSPLVATAPLLPEQTEPEDLSMSTGLHSHSSGDSPRSRCASSPPTEELDEDFELDDAAALFLQRRPPKPAPC